MKKLITFLLLCILALTFCFTGAAYAQGEEELQLPNSGINPDSPFYFADIWGERIGLFFTFGEDAKVEKALQYAEERLAEVDAMMVRNNARATIRAAGEYDGCLALATRHMERATAEGIDTTETVALATEKHIRFFGNAADNIPENAKGVVTQTRERAGNFQETALRTMAQGDPVKAMRTNLMLMERQLNHIRVLAEEPETMRLQEEIQEYERLGNLGEEISQIARRLGKDTAVDQLVGQATASQLQVLAKVHTQLQDQTQAQGAIEDAMRVCVENHVRVASTLKENNMLGGITEEAPIPEELPENVKQKLAAGGSGRK
ncbi:DUF5667 domain-containing protein [Chloroflexota bacterium]